MRRDDVLNELRALQAELARLGVAHLFLYGSVARDEATLESDVDLLVEANDRQFSVFDLVTVRDRLREALAAPVDVHDFGGFRRLATFRARIEPDLIRVF
jgi:predicted nucleotidyltransferase